MPQALLKLLGALLLLVLSLGTACADARMMVPLGQRGEEVDENPLGDPAGAVHGRLAIGGRVGVVIFSVPDMSQGPSQRRWSRFLADDPASMLPGSVALVLVENMAEAGPFQEQARHEMAEQFKRKKRPFLLLDDTGATFRRYEIPRDRTEILVFDQSGRLRDVEQDLDDQQATIARIKTITSQLLGR
jgi:hypothetical protein